MTVCWQYWREWAERVSERGSRAGPCAREAGQSTVELALALPLLLLIVLGLVDLGRAYSVAATLGNAAREAAIFAARNPNASAVDVAQRACDETGLVAFGTACPSAFSVTCDPCPSGGADVTVEVRYRFSLLSWYVVDRVLGTEPLVIRVQSRFPGLSP